MKKGAEGRMLASPSEATDTRLRTFIEKARLTFRLHGVLRVGSMSRGYELRDSDVDLMAFYETGGTLQSYPLDTTMDGIRVTLEHHDLQRFARQTANFPHNLGSVRQRLKIRDSVALEMDEPLRAFKESCRDASLDPTVLLDACALLAARWEGVRATPPTLQRLYFLRWAELLATLDLLRTKRGVAYSKPKWLCQALRTSQRGAALDVIHALDRLTPHRADQMAKALADLEGAHPPGSFKPELEGFFVTGIRDALAIAREAPCDAGPPLRYVVAGYFRYLYRKDILDTAAQAALPPIFDVAFGLALPDDYDHMLASRLFCEYVGRLGGEACAAVEADFDATIGSNLFQRAFLNVNGVPELMDCTLRGIDVFDDNDVEPVRQRIALVRKWCDRILAS